MEGVPRPGRNNVPAHHQIFYLALKCKTALHWQPALRVTHVSIQRHLNIQLESSVRLKIPSFPSSQKRFQKHGDHLMRLLSGQFHLYAFVQFRTEQLTRCYRRKLRPGISYVYWRILSWERKDHKQFIKDKRTINCK